MKSRHAFQRILFVMVVLLPFLSCKKKISQAEADDRIIKKYISDNKLDATATGSGLYYVISTQGTGVNPNINSTVLVKYKGALTNGTVFDQNLNSGVSLLLSNTIKGWQEGLPYFKKGGKGVLLIPSALGYGDQATGKIPAASVLIFDIDLVDVK
ncbi:MAG TPA: FKBP-type peptidyl-prolyl cis-trans isomerase [Bacteroidia bacterium]|nr:FKBP-type peptidyl-prolyl cis-trans isomerase [Bacteroidia bacterium]